MVFVLIFFSFIGTMKENKIKTKPVQSSKIFAKLPIQKLQVSI